MLAPSANGSNGRDAAGRFTVGNAGGPGNPHASKVAKFRASLQDAVTPADMTEIVQRLVSLAKDGDLDAARLLFDRLLGKVSEADTAFNLNLQVTQADLPDGYTIIQREDFYGNNAHELERQRAALPAPSDEASEIRPLYSGSLQNGDLRTPLRENGHGSNGHAHGPRPDSE